MKKQATKRVRKDLPARNDGHVIGGAPSVGEIVIVKSADTASSNLTTK
jgi:hypothetical protein